jgi:hypothetical protein
MEDLVRDSETKINQVFNEKLHPCTNNFTNLLKKSAINDAVNYYYPFKLFWLVHLNKCDNKSVFNANPVTSCSVNESIHKFFFIHAVRNIFLDATKDNNELSCYNKTNTECQNAINDIKQDDLYRTSYQKQAKYIEIAAKSITLGLKENYVSWIRTKWSNKDCINNLIVDCGGKLSFYHLRQIR